MRKRRRLPLSFLHVWNYVLSLVRHNEADRQQIVLQAAGKVIDWIFLYFGYLRPFELVVKSSPSPVINKHYEPKLIFSFFNYKMENLTKTCSGNDLQGLHKTASEVAHSPNKKVVRPMNLLGRCCV